ncbi:MAG: 8-oxo-dGTP diphosphatase MutT [Woeseiaceae bacterium]|nr:8-oxo-dGTP diphosphatase MutT [Woeseiaceae bacterium]
MHHFDVAAGILCDAAGRVLIAERLGDGPFHGLWEFPGGKIAPGESPLQALTRELAEELGIEVNAAYSFMNLRHEYPDRLVTIEFFIVNQWRRDPEGREGQALRWVKKSQLGRAQLLPADEAVVAALQQMDN